MGNFNCTCKHVPMGLLGQAFMRTTTDLNCPVHGETQTAVCRAPRGKVQIVHVDPRDHWAVRVGEPTTLDEAKKVLDGMMLAQREVMKVFDHNGNRVLLEEEVS